MTAQVAQGEVLDGKYRVERVLGSGGMGVVVVATHLALHERVAIKFLKDEAAAIPSVVERFAREARAMIRIKSEHVARVLDVGQTPAGAPFMVMEYLEGRDLATLIDELGKVPVTDAVDIVLQAGEAIAEAHALGIIHRDLKPANLFLTSRADGTPSVKVLDFGISKVGALDRSQGELSLTRTAMPLGSPLYMAPEQIASARDVDGRADIWSMGAMLYELLTGQAPFDADNISHLQYKILQETPKRLQELDPGLPPGLDEVLQRCARTGRWATSAVPIATAWLKIALKRRSRAVRARSSVPRCLHRKSSAALCTAPSPRAIRFTATTRWAKPSAPDPAHDELARSGDFWFAGAMQSNVPLPESPYQKIAHAPESRFCPSCGGVGEPKREARGSTLVEVLLWFTCVGGLIYSIWRRSNKIERCPYCNAPGVVLPDSPAARRALGRRAGVLPCRSAIMERRQLGNTGLELTVIGFGAWAIGGDNWRFGWGPQDDHEAVEAIRRGLDLGVNWIDTAAVYGLGHSEELVARALEGRRGEVIVATKCSLVWNDRGDISSSLARESVRRECEASLRRLRADHIDLYQIHWPNDEPRIEEGWEEIGRLIEEGKVRYGGVSNFGVGQMKRAHELRPIASLQPPYSMLRREVESGILAYCSQQGIGVVAYSPMQSGLLTGSFDRARLAAGDWRARDAEFREPALSATLELVEGLRSIASAHGKSVAELAIAWVLRRPEITSAIVGARRPSQIEQTAGAAGWVLTAEERAAIEKLLDRRRRRIPDRTTRFRK